MPISRDLLGVPTRQDSEAAAIVSKTSPARPSMPLRPLADLLRPQALCDLVGQKVPGMDVDSPIPQLASQILWGPPGCGKTSYARLVAKASGLPVVSLSGVTSSAQQFRDVFLRAETGKVALLVDEIHHLNRSQQDIFLPHLENGHILLLGTTTENPSFALRPALLSRCKVVVFERLTEAALEILLQRAEAFLGVPLPLDPGARQALISMADGDGRYLLNRVEELRDTLPFAFETPLPQPHSENTTATPAADLLVPALSSVPSEAPQTSRAAPSSAHTSKPKHSPSLSEASTQRPPLPLTAEALSQLLQKRKAVYDRSEGHYNLISALHKSMRGSDVDAALYWLARMLDGGEDPLYILRRVVRFAVEDVGLADPSALTQAIAAQQAYQFLGSPEGELALAQAVIYCATAPKSNAGYTALNTVMDFVRHHGTPPPPKHILNAPTQLMKQQGYNKGYKYDHDYPHAFSGQDFFPEDMPRTAFYKPVDRGFERELQKRLAWWSKLRKSLSEDRSEEKAPHT